MAFNRWPTTSTLAIAKVIQSRSSTHLFFAQQQNDTCIERIGWWTSSAPFFFGTAPLHLFDSTN
jgi:hypothetical protein